MRPFRLEGETLVFQWDYLGKTEEFTVGFPAPYQAENAALAVTALSVSRSWYPGRSRAPGLKERQMAGQDGTPASRGLSGRRP